MDFCGWVNDFQKKAQDASGKDGGELQLLDLGSKLIHGIHKLPVDMATPSSAIEFISETSDLCLAACQRLTGCFEAYGLKWFRTQLTSGVSGSDAAKSAQEAISMPTPFLKNCIATCSLCADDLKKLEFGSKLIDLANIIIPEYVRINAANQVLLQEISPQASEACQGFMAQVEEKVGEHLEAFKGTVAQLAKLHEKYLPLGATHSKPNVTFWYCLSSDGSCLMCERPPI